MKDINKKLSDMSIENNKFLKKQFNQWEVVKYKYTKTMLLLWLSILIYVVLFSVYTYYKVRSNPSEINVIKEYLNLKIGMGVTRIDFLNIIIMNIISTSSIVLFSIIPIPYLYALPAIATFSSVGQIVGCVTYEKGIYVGLKLAITGILPHGVLETTAYIMVLILAKNINDMSIGTLNHIWKRHHLKYKVIGSALYHSLELFFMLVVAAFIESFITPIIMKIFM